MRAWAGWDENAGLTKKQSFINCQQFSEIGVSSPCSVTHWCVTMSLALEMAKRRSCNQRLRPEGPAMGAAQADVAQWQSNGFVNRRLSVRVRPSAPAKARKRRSAQRQR
jgi:hypothetical protein